MLVALVVLAVVAVAAIVAALVTRAKLVTERERIAAAETAASERGAELAIAHEELTSSRDALAAETSAHAADAERLEKLRVDLAGVEQLAAEAEQRARDAAAASGVEPGVVWPLELQRSERLWRFSVSPGPQADSPLAATRVPLITALKVEVDAARNDIGAEVELAADLPPEVEPATAVLVLRIAQELLADVVRRSETATLQVTTDGDDIVVAVVAVDRDGEPMLPEPLPVESPLIEPIENGVRLVGCAPLVEQDTGDVAH
jgi:GAF domain-containing protein